MLETTGTVLFDLIAIAVAASQEAAKIIKNRDNQKAGASEKKSQEFIESRIKNRFPKIVCKSKKELNITDAEVKMAKLGLDNETVRILKSEEIVRILEADQSNFIRGLTVEDLVVWIDPLDGTREHVIDDYRLNKEITILIGIAYIQIDPMTAVINTSPIAGVINQPYFEALDDYNFEYSDGIVWGICGLGAYHNRVPGPGAGPGKREFRKIIVVTNDEDRTIKKVKVTTSRSHSDSTIKEWLEAIENSEIVYKGGCGYKSLLVIENKVDCYLYPSRGLRRFDTCAPEAIIRALGGQSSNILRENYDYSDIRKEFYENLHGFVAALKNYDSYMMYINNEMCTRIKKNNYGDKKSKKDAEPSVPTITINKSNNEPTDAEGKFKYNCSAVTLESKYVRMAHTTKIQTIVDYLRYKWNLTEKPKLILSCLNSKIQSKENKEVYVKGLVKASMDAGGWIISSGYHSGTTKELAHVIRQEGYLHPKKKVVMLGITDWHTVAGSKCLLKENPWPIEDRTYNPYKIENVGKNEQCLDPYHTHFLLIDSGKPNPIIEGNELRGEFREAIEYQLAQHLKIPIIKIVLGKHADKLISVKAAIKNNIPCLFLEGTDVLGDFAPFLLSIFKQSDSRVKISVATSIRNEVKKRWQLTESHDAAKIELYQDCIQDIIKNPNLPKLIFTYSFSNSNKTSFDTAILTALIQSQKHVDLIERIKMTVEWNRFDVAEAELFNEKVDWLVSDKWIDTPYILTRQAIIDNKYQFVNLFMDHGMTVGRNWTRSTLKELLLGRAENIPFYEKLIENYEEFFNNISSINIYRNITDASNLSKILDYPERDFFLCCLVIGNVEMAKLFLFKTPNVLHTSLVAAKICRSLKRMLKNSKDHKNTDDFTFPNYENLANQFETLAYDLLEYCYRKDKEQAVKLLTTKAQEFEDKMCFEIVRNDFRVTKSDAEMSKKIIASDCFQKAVNDIWAGESCKLSKCQFIVYLMLSFILYPILLLSHFPYRAYKVVNRQEKCKYKWLFMFFEMTSIPLTKLILDGFSYSAFLILYSYMLLSNYYSREYSQNKDLLGLSIVEIILIIWRFSYICLMIHAIYHKINWIFKSKRGKTDKFVKWFLLTYKIGILILVFSLSTGFRFSSSSDLVFASRYVTWLYFYNLSLESIFLNMVSFIVFDSMFLHPLQEPLTLDYIVLLCFELMYWYVMLLEKFVIMKHFGPKLEMIKLMTIELLYFWIILAVIIVAFGVCIQALMYHNQKFNSQLVETVFFSAFLVIGGENGIANTMLNSIVSFISYVLVMRKLHLKKIIDSCTDEPKNETWTQDDCPHWTGKKVSLVFYAVYLVLLMVLAINLLIAILNKTFEMVNKQAKRIWAVQRYKLLINDFTNRSSLPAPLILVSLLINFQRWLWNHCCGKDMKSANCMLPLRHGEYSSVRQSDNEINESCSNICCKIFCESRQYYVTLSEKEKDALDLWFSNMCEQFFFHYSKNTDQ